MKNNYNTYSSPTSDIDAIVAETKSYSTELTPEQAKAMKQLDSEAKKCDNADLQDISDITGVIAGVKPASIVRKSAAIENFIADSGYAYEDVDRELVTFSRSPKAAHILSELFHEFWRGPADFVQNSYDIGQLLGYPKTATDYYLHRLASDNYRTVPMIYSEEAMMVGHTPGLVLSPDHWREEMAEYEMPIREAFAELAPKSFARRLEQEKKTAKRYRKLGSAALTLFNDESVAVKLVK